MAAGWWPDSILGLFMNHSRLRIAIPTLNAGQFLSDALGSIRFCYPEAEVVIADSGSTDDTLRIARQAEVRVVHVAAGNLYAAVNCALADSQTDWVAYLNSDDRILSPLTFDTSCDIVYGDQKFIDGKGAEIYRWKMAEVGNIPALLAGGVMPFCFQGTLIRRSLFTRLGGFDTRFRYCADFDFIVRSIKLNARMQRACVITGAFRLHGGQLTQSHAEAMRREVLESVARWQERPSRLSFMFALALFRGRNVKGLAQRSLFHLARGGSPFPCSTSVPPE
jgi:GT2 family glycosyltransferase